MIPKPPNWINTMSVTFPKFESVDETSITDSPVTETADVDVKNASRKDNGAPVAEIGSASINAPTVIKIR
jgi:hypothetical protein